MTRLDELEARLPPAPPDAYLWCCYSHVQQARFRIVEGRLDGAIRILEDGERMFNAKAAVLADYRRQLERRRDES